MAAVTPASPEYDNQRLIPLLRLEHRVMHVSLSVGNLGTLNKGVQYAAWEGISGAPAGVEDITPSGNNTALLIRGTGAGGTAVGKVHLWGVKESLVGGAGAFPQDGSTWEMDSSSLNGLRWQRIRFESVGDGDTYACPIPITRLAWEPDGAVTAGASITAIGTTAVTFDTESAGSADGWLHLWTAS